VTFFKSENVPDVLNQHYTCHIANNNLCLCILFIWTLKGKE